MESFATPYLCLFNDGEKDHDKGVIGIHGVLTYKRFQQLMAQKTGLPAQNLSAVFVCRRSGSDGQEKKQKLPINENTNFCIILNQHNPSKERDAHFLISVKKSKKDRKTAGRSKRSSFESEDKEDKEQNDDGSDSSSPRSNSSPHQASSPESSLRSFLHAVDLSPRLLPAPSRPSAVPSSIAQAAAAIRAELRPPPINVRREASDFSPSTRSLPTPAASSSPAARQLSPDMGRSSTHDSVTPRLAAMPSPIAPPASAKPAAAATPAPPEVIEPPRSVPAVTPSIRPFSAIATSMAPIARPSTTLPISLHSGTASSLSSKGKACKLCSMCRESGRMAPFHWCVDDQVVPGFRGPSPAGPIGPRSLAMVKRVEITA
eukprot:jgi/Chlat1/7510/Chrsp61S09147